MRIRRDGESIFTMKALLSSPTICPRKIAKNTFKIFGESLRLLLMELLIGMTLQLTVQETTTLLLFMVEWFNILGIQDCNGSWERELFPYSLSYGRLTSWRVHLMDFALWMEQETTKRGLLTPFCTVINLLWEKIFGVTREFRLWQIQAKTKEDMSAAQRQISFIKSGLNSMERLIERMIGTNFQRRKRRKKSFLMLSKSTLRQAISFFLTAELSTAIRFQQRMFWESAPTSVCFLLTMSLRRFKLKERRL